MNAAPAPQLPGPGALRATWQDDRGAVTAVESPRQIRFLAGDPPRLRATLSRPFGDLSSLGDHSLPCFPAGYYRHLLDSPSDGLARAALWAGEPSFAAVSDLLPPVLGMTFLGDDRAAERAIVRADGAIDGHFPPAFPLDTADPAQTVLHGLLAEGMNAVCYGHWDGATSSGTELVAFGLADDASGRLAVYRRLRTVTADGERLIHQRSCGEVEPVTWEFYAALLAAYERDREFFSRGAQVRLPEAAVREGLRATWRLGDLTFRGVLPRYGVGQYDQPQHNSFPPATIFLAWACLEWGRFDRAREILTHYLARYVRPDGTFDYYGPAVAEYGQMLSLAARYVQLTGDRSWWGSHLPILRPVVGRLLSLREASRERNAGDVRRCGLIPGLPEADYNDQPHEWGKHYFAGDAWVCRGVREVGRVLAAEAATRAEGQRLLAQSLCHEADLKAAVRACTDRAARFLPAGPDDPPAFSRMTESRHASYCNYRYLLEMLSAGVLDAAALRTVSAYRRSHGGELLGMTRFEDHLDDWPAWHYARALLDVDDVAGYLVTFYGHLAHHHSRGNWAAYEQVEVLPGAGREHRTEAGHAEQVLPCQMMAPLMLKSALVDEERDRERLHLLRGCPAAWLSAPGGLSFRGLPTRWGPVSLRARAREGRLTVSLRLSFPGPGPEEVHLRLPPGGGPVTATVNDLPGALDPRRGTLILRGNLAGRHQVAAEGAHGSRS